MADPTPPTSTAAASPAAHTRAGLAFGVGAYMWWGLVAHYFKLVAHVPAVVVLGHRVVWSVLLLVIIVTATRGWGDVRALIQRPRVWPWLAMSTLLIAVNWVVFIYAVAAHRLVEASLGYFINPLLTVLLGMVFLRERLRPAQWAAVILAAAGVAVVSTGAGGLPWISLTLPVSFGLYGLIRKLSPVGPVTGMFAETALLFPAALVYLVVMHAAPGAGSMNTPGTLALLPLAGVVTTVPLLWFVAAVQRLPLVTLGFVQYLNPTMQLLTAVLIFGEPFGARRAVAFALIWAGLVVFVVELVMRIKRQSRAEGSA